MNENKIKITVHVKMVAKLGKVNELLDLLEICAASSRKESGCEYYEVVQSIAEPNTITLVEKYSNHDAFNAHLNNPDIRKFIDTQQHELLTSMSNSIHITRIDCNGDRGEESSDNLSFRDEITS